MSKRPDYYEHNEHGRIIEGVTNPDEKNARVYEAQYKAIRDDFEDLRAESPALFNRVINFILNAKEGVDLSTAHTPGGKRLQDLDKDLKRDELGKKTLDKKELEKKALTALNQDKDGDEIPTLKDQYENTFSENEQETINNLISWGINSNIVRNVVKDWKSHASDLSSTYEPPFFLQISTSTAPESNSRYNRIEQTLLTTLQENKLAASVITELFEKGTSGDFSEPLRWFDKNAPDAEPQVRTAFSNAVAHFDRLEIPVIKEVIKNDRDLINAL